MVQVEVKEASKDDVIKQGDYVITTDGKEVIQVSAYPDNRDVFSGQVVKGSTYFTLGIYSNTWEKDQFRKFYGTITIKCD